MKTDLTGPGSYSANKALPVVPGKNSTKPIGALPQKLSEKSPDYKLELSGQKPAGADVPLTSTLTPPPLPSPSLPDLPKLSSSKEAVKDTVKSEAPKKIEEIKEPEVKDGSVKKPNIIFIKGLDVFSSPSKSEGGYAGLGRMAEAVEGSKVFGWGQKDEIIKEIKKTHADYPVILVGHSLGGDTAVEIADELDSLKEKFRPVDLLITIDAIGFSHDIIPQNVKKHLNVFGESSLFLNDGPHVARREEMTNVRNILSPLDHTDIDDDREIQFEIMNLIQNTLSKKT